MVEIQYNGVTLANLKADQSAILECTNQKMLGPVTVTVPALIYYDGSVTISGGVELIGFTIGGDHYEAEDGMTWLQWCDSEYSKTDSGLTFSISGNTVKYSGTINGFVTSGYISSSSSTVKPTDVITDGEYTLVASGGGAD